MSFFKKSNGEDAAAKATGENELGGFTIIPDQTTILAVVKSVEIEQANNYHDERISIKWETLKPAEYQGVAVKQNIKCYSKKDSERDKALDMLAAIDKNAGGKLAENGTQPTVESLNRALAGKSMLLTMAVFEADDGSKVNWVSKVAPRTTANAPAPTQPAPVQQPDLDGDIPF